MASGAAPTTPVVVMVFDELPTTSLMTADGRVDAERYPNFAAPGGRLDLVPQRHERRRRHLRRRPGHPHRAAPQAELPTVARATRATSSRCSGAPTTSTPPSRSRTSAPRRCATRRARPPGPAHAAASLARDLRDRRGPAAAARRPRRRAPGRSTATGRTSPPRRATTGSPRPPQDRRRRRQATRRGRRSGSRATTCRPSACAPGRAVVRTMKPGRKPGLWMVHYVDPARAVALPARRQPVRRRRARRCPGSTTRPGGRTRRCSTSRGSATS